MKKKKLLMYCKIGDVFMFSDHDAHYMVCHDVDSQQKIAVVLDHKVIGRGNAFRITDEYDDDNGCEKVVVFSAVLKIEEGET